ncbi:MAG: hypothetical protein KDE47_33630 [Caldilineaceae bacterium]|nr:hypothetical protein [Caldilineaceae bacterium]
MTKREKMKLITFFYDPAVTDLGVLTAGYNSISEETLLTEMEQCLEKGGLIHVSHVQAEMFRVVQNCPSQAESSSAYQWVGVTFVPTQSVGNTTISRERNAYAY